MVPFISILQSNSPQVEEKDPVGAEAGKLFNTVTKELYDEVVVIPVHRESAFVEWIPRTKGGGFVAMHDPEGEVVQNAVKENNGSRVKLKLGENDLVETHYVYALVLDPAGSEVQGFAVIAFKSTAIKPYRELLTSLYMLKGKPPIFANRVRLQTTKQKNEKGTYYNYKISPLRESYAASLINPAEERSLLQEATAFRDQVLNGLARADFTQERAAGTGVPAEDAENAPF